MRKYIVKIWCSEVLHMSFKLRCRKDANRRKINVKSDNLNSNEEFISILRESIGVNEYWPESSLLMEM